MKKGIFAGIFALLIAVMFSVGTAWGAEKLAFSKEKPSFWQRWFGGAKTAQKVEGVKSDIDERMEPAAKPMISPIGVLLKKPAISFDKNKPFTKPELVGKKFIKKPLPSFIPPDKLLSPPAPDEAELITDWGDILLNYVMPNMYYNLVWHDCYGYELAIHFWNLTGTEDAPYTEYPVQFFLYYVFYSSADGFYYYIPIDRFIADASLSHNDDMLIMDFCTIHRVHNYPPPTSKLCDNSTVIVPELPADGPEYYPHNLGDVLMGTGTSTWTTTELEGSPVYDEEYITNWCTYSMNQPSAGKTIIADMRLGFQVNTTGQDTLIVKDLSNGAFANFIRYQLQLPTPVTYPTYDQIDDVFPYSSANKEWSFPVP